MIKGNTCFYPEGSQLAAATAFLAAHKGSVDLITIDNGGNDYLGCLDSSPPSYNAACIAGVSQTVTTNLTSMLPSQLSPYGSSQAHENTQPYLTLSFCIALQGIFPSQT